MLNAKVLKMVKDVSVTGKVVTKRPEPVTLDEIDELLDEAAEASTTFDDIDEVAASECECCECCDSNTAAPKVEKLTPTERVDRIDEFAKITTACSKNEVFEKATNEVVEESGVMKGIVDSYYPIAADAKCASCGKEIKKGDIIQFDKNGNIFHSDCKFFWGECSLEVVQPDADKVNLFGETFETKVITERELQLAELKSKPKNSLKNLLSISKFAINYGEYISKLNADDLIKSKVSTLKKDSKANIVKLENSEAKAE